MTSLREITRPWMLAAGLTLALFASACATASSNGVDATATGATSSSGLPGSSPGSPPGSETNALVTRAVDGDTIEVLFKGSDVTVRLIGIDTPESVKPGVSVQCYAIAASDFTKHELEGRRVRLEFDVERIDQYGRALAYIWLGGVLFNETLVRQGCAFVTTFPPDVRYEQVFLDAQREARTHERGVWGKCVSPSSAHTCDPSYRGVCIPPPPPDLHCGDIPFRHFVVLSPDPQHFDSDSNGIGCESG